MATVIKMPKWGLTMTAGTVTDWLYAEGADVSEGVPMLTVETEKAVNDVEAPADGVLVRIVAQAGQEIPVSSPIAVIAAEGEDLSPDQIDQLIADASPKKKAAGASRATGDGKRAGQAAARSDTGRVNASPAARRRAQELGLDIAGVEATGPGGRITSEDVERAADEADADPAPREEMVALADGRQLNVLTAGPKNAPTIVFLHGLGGSQATWQLVLGELADRYRLVAIDLPGHGRSSAGEADYSVAGHAAAVAAALTSMGLKGAVIVGHSLGGAVALTIAHDHAGLVSSLVLINSAGLGDGISSELTTLMAGPAGTATARGLLELFYTDQRLVADRAVADMAATQTDAAWAAQQATAHAAFAGDKQRVDLLPRMPEISIPTLILWGDQDRVLSMADGVAMLTVIPDATMKVLAGIGHVPQVEAATLTAAAIDRHVKSLG